MLNPQLVARLQQIYQHLDQYTYFDLLKVSPDASADEIRQAFHRMAMSLHPDRYNGDPAVKQMVYVIYKRIAEGYRVLKNKSSRDAYRQGLANGQLRLVQTARKPSAPKQAADAIENPQARKFFLLGKDAERRGDKKGARLNYKFALDMVGGNHPTIEERLRSVSGGP